MTAPVAADADVRRCLDEIMPAVLDVFAPEIAQHVEQARDHLERWVDGHGLVRKEAARHRFAHADFAWFAAVTYPTADRESLFLIADWFAWLFLLDDQFDDGAVGRDPDRVRDLMEQMAQVLLTDGDTDTDGGTGRSGTAPASRPPIVE
ncbi:hypothetical protein ACFQ08_21480, partial [Streptosporangium algeriense]